MQVLSTHLLRFGLGCVVLLEVGLIPRPRQASLFTRYLPTGK